ncbi:MAG: DegT/DnrJ/EryC1/StrS aminotransferase, partial [Lentisphaerae bacterium]|nr:DegT/DnrJ/EryC1/StrS aminotransferase [Lentisphaerota bacterium]
QGAPHPAINPYNLPENQVCRMDLKKDSCQKSLDILNRTVLIGTHPNRKQDETDAMIERILAAAKKIS